MALEYGEFAKYLNRGNRLAGENFASVQVRIAPLDSQIAEITDQLAGIAGGVNKAVVLAINDTLRSGRQVIVEGLADITTLKQKDVRSRLTITKATAERAYGKVEMRFARFALKRFKHKERRKKTGWGTAASGSGVTVQVFQSGESLQLPHAFLANTKMRGLNIFQRTVLGPGSDRNKIGVAPSINIADVFWKSPNLGQRVVDRMNEQFAKNLQSKTEYLLSKSIT